MDEKSEKKSEKSFLESVGKTVEEVGGTITNTAVGVGEIVGNTAFQAGKSALETAVDLGEATAHQAHKIIEQATETAGNVSHHLNENWLIRKLSGILNLNWLTGNVDNVDLEKSASQVKKLQQKYPQDSPSQLAHRIMVDKAMQAGGIGFASSILPGFAAALLAVDLAATTQLQSEMVYQISAAYGLDLKDPARRGEVLAIFGLALGGGRLLKAAGLRLLRNIPLAGAMIGASSNATMIYSLGYAACRFYEAKLDTDNKSISPEKLRDLQQQSENYLETAIAQEAVMDQILVHTILATYPGKTWSEILPELKALNLSNQSLAAISQNMASPQPLDSLLEQLNPDFAVPLLAQCYRIVQTNGEIKPVEAEIIQAIATKFDIDLNVIESTVNQR